MGCWSSLSEAKRRGGLLAPHCHSPGIPLRLSFNNLVEAYVLRALRTQHGVSIDAVRKAINFATKPYKVRRLLLSPELRTDAGDLLLDKYGELVNLTRSGQLAMKKILEAHL